MDVSDDEVERKLDEEIVVIMNLLAVVYPVGCDGVIEIPADAIKKKSENRLTLRSMIVKIFKLIESRSSHLKRLLSVIVLLCFVGCGSDTSNSGDSTNISQVTSIAVDSGNVYASGYYINSSDVRVTGYWLNGMWNELGTIDATKHSHAASITIDSGNVYVAGWCVNSSNVVVAGYWLNGTWTALTPLDVTKTSAVTSIYISGGSVYAAGYCLDSTGLMIPGYWMNGVWIPFAPIDPTRTSIVYNIIVSGADVYAAGWGLKSVYVRDNPLAPPSPDDPLTPIDESLIFPGHREDLPVAGYWINGSWTSLVPVPEIPTDTPITVKSSRVTSLFISGTNVYAGGWRTGKYISDSALPYWDEDIEIPGYWLNEIWTELIPPYPLYAARVTSMFVSGTDVYAAGYCNNSVGVSMPGYWLNGVWIELPPVSKLNLAEVVSIFVYGTDVYAGGYCNNGTGYRLAGYWLNGVWKKLTPP